jgi:DNA-directed RNA polymerase subunit RPC12/RpoP
MEDSSLMILEPKSTSVAYRCPACGSGIMSAVDVFRLAADRVRLKCSNPDCTSVKSKDSESPRDNAALDITLASDGSVRLSVPCIFCGKPHVFNVNPSLFYGKDIFILPCPYSGINICFMGEANHVKAELARNELELLDMLEENGIESFRDLDADEAALPDPQIMEIVTFVIHDLDAEGKIYCKCHPEGSKEAAPADSFDLTSAYDGDYAAELTDAGMRVWCKKCGAEKIISTNSLISAHDFLNCDSITLE